MPALGGISHNGLSGIFGIMMKFNLILLLALIFTFLSVSSPRADTLYLKNGRSIEGIIKSEEGESILLEVCSGSVKFRKSEIERIERSGPDESQAMRENWERQIAETHDRILEQQAKEEKEPKKVDYSQNKLHIIVDVTLNNKVEAPLMLDTGATLIVLTKDIAERLGINLDNVQPDAKLTLGDGGQVDAKRIILDSVKVEGVEANDVDAAVILNEEGELGFGQGVLGMSFLNRFNFKVDQKEKKLILEKL